MTTGIDGPRRISAEQLLSMDYVRECFELRGCEVYWRDRPVRHFATEHAWKVFQSRYAGKPAGRKEMNGYVSINMRHNGTRLQFQAHRVVWMLHYGKWPEQTIDHINRIRDDNRIENLRDVPVATNNRNAANKRVFPYVGPHTHGRFEAQVKIGDKSIHIGIFDTGEEAHAHRLMVNAELERVARSLAKKSKTGRARKDHQTFSQQTPEGSKQ